MKSLNLLLCVLIWLPAFARAELSVFTDKWGDQRVYVHGLSEDLFQEYTLQPSRGPRWGTLNFVSEQTSYDFWEAISYWSESGFPFEQCPDFSKEDFERVMDSELKPSLRWQSIKHKASSSGRTLWYLATLMYTIQTPSKSCTYVSADDQVMFFSNKNTNRPAQYLGLWSKTPQ